MQVIKHLTLAIEQLLSLIDNNPHWQLEITKTNFDPETATWRFTFRYLNAMTKQTANFHFYIMEQSLVQGGITVIEYMVRDLISQFAQAQKMIKQ